MQCNSGIVEEYNNNPNTTTTQVAFTCLKLTIETLEKDVKYAHIVINKDIRTTPGCVVVSLLLTMNIFHIFL